MSPAILAARATNFHVVESRRCFFVGQHGNLLPAGVVIGATNNSNL